MPIIKDFEEGGWEAPPRGYYKTEVKQKTLWSDEETGATLALLRFPVGVADEIHVHPEANQICVGLSGEIEMPDGSRFHLRPDAVWIFPKGEEHGATEFAKEGLILFYWDGPPRPVVP